jgi:hypothetical protein
VKIGLVPPSTTYFTDPDELVKAAQFDNLSKRLKEDMASLPVDFEKLPLNLRDSSEVSTLVERAVMAYKCRYFKSLNRTNSSYVLSEYGQRLREECEQRNREIADESVTPESEVGEGRTSSCNIRTIIEYHSGPLVYMRNLSFPKLKMIPFTLLYFLQKCLLDFPCILPYRKSVIRPMPGFHASLPSGRLVFFYPSSPPFCQLRI